MKRPLLLLATTAAGALAAAACGGGGSTNATTTTPPASAVAAALTPAVEVSTAHTSIGTVLVAGPKRLTVYRFEGDHGPSSTCSGACASVWPPVTTSGRPIAAGGAIGAKLSTIARSDGTQQVAYGGHPLYYFVKDTAGGQTHGQGIDGFGGRWYAVRPDGSTITGSEHRHAPSAKPEPPASTAAASSESAPPPEPAPPASAAHEEEKPMEETPREETAAPPHSAPMAPENEGIPQGGGGDNDGDNHGGPSDGDGNI
jgi:predicted lipoprotein with Yx(FWY)xxD motif